MRLGSCGPLPAGLTTMLSFPSRLSWLGSVTLGSVTLGSVTLGSVTLGSVSLDSVSLGSVMGVLTVAGGMVV